jgi:hypothetical protein
VQNSKLSLDSSRSHNSTIEKIRGGGVSILFHADPRISFQRMFHNLGDDIMTETVHVRLLLKV